MIIILCISRIMTLCCLPIIHVVTMTGKAMFLDILEGGDELLRSCNPKMASYFQRDPFTLVYIPEIGLPKSVWSTAIVLNYILLQSA